MSLSRTLPCLAINLTPHPAGWKSDQFISRSVPLIDPSLIFQSNFPRINEIFRDLSLLCRYIVPFELNVLPMIGKFFQVHSLICIRDEWGSVLTRSFELLSGFRLKKLGMERPLGESGIEIRVSGECEKTEKRSSCDIYPQQTNTHTQFKAITRANTVALWIRTNREERGQRPRPGTHLFI